MQTVFVCDRRNFSFSKVNMCTSKMFSFSWKTHVLWFLFQINFQLKPNTRLTGFADLPEVLFPLFWIDETATIDDENADFLRSKMTIPLLLADIFLYGVGFGVSSLCIVLGTFLLCKAGGK